MDAVMITSLEEVPPVENMDEYMRNVCCPWWAAFTAMPPLLESQVLQVPDGRARALLAAAYGHVGALAGMDPSAYCDDEGVSVYMLAAIQGHVHVMEHLEQHHPIDINHTSTDGDTAYMWAAWQGRVGVMKHLDAKFSIPHGHRNNSGDTAYMVAACEGRVDVMKYLDGRCTIDPTDGNSNGTRVYGMAAASGSVDAMKHLEGEYPIDPYYANKRTGVTAYELAHKVRGNHANIRLLDKVRHHGTLFFYKVLHDIQMAVPCKQLHHIVCAWRCSRDLEPKP